MKITALLAAGALAAGALGAVPADAQRHGYGDRHHGYGYGGHGFRRGYNGYGRGYGFRGRPYGHGGYYGPHHRCRRFGYYRHLRRCFY